MVIFHGYVSLPEGMDGLEMENPILVIGNPTF